jgi:hypothetical protein
MKVRTKITLFIVASLLIAASADAAPFTAVFSGDLAWTSPNTVHGVGSGFATRLGFSTMTGDSTITGPSSTGCAGGYSAHNLLVYKSNATGDLLYVEVFDDGCPIPNQGMSYLSQGTYSITGGTGQFANASGTGTFTARPDFNVNKYVSVLTGTITAPAN